MADVSHAIQPKSDQLNAEDLIGSTMTAVIEGVDVKQTTEQPISVFLAGHQRPWKPCKSMCKIMAVVWGKQSEGWIGHSVTLYNDPKVKWAGVEVGGIRISHMTGIDKPQVFNLSVSRGKRQGYTIQPLQAAAPQQAPAHQPAPPPQQQAPQRPTQEELNHYAGVIDICETMDQLAAAWGKIPPHVKPAMVPNKDAKKAEIEATPEPNKPAEDADISGF